MSNNDPNGPYIFQSGKKKGKAVEQIMFEDYGYLNFIWEKMKQEQGKKNRLHVHLDWLLSKGENRPVTKLCPQCGQRPIQFLSILGEERYGYSMGVTFSCCHKKECQQCLITEKTPLFLEPKFSNALYFRKKTDERQFLGVLKKLFGIQKLTKEGAHEFFKD